MTMAICKTCGSEFNANGNKTTFCSIECYRKTHSKKQVIKRKTIPYKTPCPICGQPKSPNSKHCSLCSKDFRWLWNPNKFMPLLKKICQVCDKDFWTITENQLYCSDLCRRQVRATRQRTTKYQNRKERGIRKGKLASWATTADKGCMICGESRVIDFAHINKDEVIPLCPTHHRLMDRGLLNEVEIDNLKEYRYGDIPAVPIVPTQGVMDKTRKVPTRGITQVTPSESEPVHGQGQLSQYELQGRECL